MKIECVASLLLNRSLKFGTSDKNSAILPNVELNSFPTQGVRVLL